MQLIDKDLLSMQEVRELVEAANAVHLGLVHPGQLLLGLLGRLYQLPNLLHGQEIFID